MPAATSLRLYVSGPSGTLDLVWSQVFIDGRELGALAGQKREEFERRGWALVAPQ